MRIFILIVRTETQHFRLIAIGTSSSELVMAMLDHLGVAAVSVKPLEPRHAAI